LEIDDRPAQPERDLAVGCEGYLGFASLLLEKGNEDKSITRANF